jgi:hypothetical protein
MRGWGHLTVKAMPQENYNLIDFNWDRSLEKLKQSSLVVGDLSDEEIERTRGVACAHIKVKNKTVSFNLSQYGKIQISDPNADLLRRARSQLNKLIVCSRWVPADPTTTRPSEKYQSIIDLPEAQEADWSKIPKREILRLNQWFLAVKDYNYHWLLDLVRSTLKRYAKIVD